MNKFSKFEATVVCEMHPLFKGLLWVSAARSTDETREVITNIHIEREGLLCHIVATDGRRMHVHTFEPGMFDDDIAMIEPGLYEVIAKSGKLIVIAESECGENYPNWRKIIPDYEPTHNDALNKRIIAMMGIRTGVLLASDFVVDAIGFGHGRGKDDTVLVEYGSPEPMAAFVIKHDIGKAIVMPMRQTDENALNNEEIPKSDAEATPDIPGLTESQEEEKKPAKKKTARP